MAGAYLKSIGVVVYEDENCLEALNRHAEEHSWKKKTQMKHFECMNSEVCKGSNRLEWWNDLLDRLGYEKQPSISKCREVYRGVFINIYDVESGRFDNQFETLAALKKYSRKKNLFYPRETAKKNGLQIFLKVLC